MEIKKVKLLNLENAEKYLSIGSGCIIIENKKVLLVRGRGGDKFKFPGGHIKDTENMHQAAIREVEEEIQCKVEIIGDPFYYLFQPDDKLQVLLVNYLAKIVEGIPQANNEIEEVGWFDVDNLPECFDNVNQEIAELKKSAI